MKNLANYVAAYEAKAEKFSTDPKKLKEDPRIANAVDIHDVDVTKVKSIGKSKVKSGVSANDNGSERDAWAVNPPYKNWAQDYANWCVSYEKDKNVNRVWERFRINKKKGTGDFFIQGKAGWAKTSIVQDIAAKMGYTTLVVYLDKAIAADLGGIPVAATRKKTGALYMEYSHPGWLTYMEEHPDEKFLLFFDEMNQANGEVLNALMPIVLEHVICGVRIPNMIVGAAGNLDEENMTLSALNQPLIDRFDPIIKWEAGTLDAWDNTFEYFHDKFDDVFGDEFLEDLHSLWQYLYSPRNVERILFDWMITALDEDTFDSLKAFASENKFRDERLDKVIDPSSKISNSDKDEFVKMVMEFIYDKWKKDHNYKEDGNSSNSNSVDFDTTPAEESIMVALEAGYFWADPNKKEIQELGLPDIAMNKRFLCTEDNAITEIFNPDITGVTAEVYQRLLKRMSKAGKKPKFKTKDEEALKKAKGGHWIVDIDKWLEDNTNGQQFLVNTRIRHLIKQRSGGSGRTGRFSRSNRD
ncbi:MAG: AAA family ATPase [Clostridia bacterium]|nr:AAA family ATPase [Clostridia bacterium]